MAQPSSLIWCLVLLILTIFVHSEDELEERHLEYKQAFRPMKDFTWFLQNQVKKELL